MRLFIKKPVKDTIVYFINKIELLRVLTLKVNFLFNIKETIIVNIKPIDELSTGSRFIISTKKTKEVKCIKVPRRPIIPYAINLLKFICLILSINRC